MKKKIFVLIMIIILVFAYFTMPSVREDKMRTIFNEYLEEQFKEEYSNFEIYDDVYRDAPGIQSSRGYAGYGKSYSIEYVHKKYNWIHVMLYTSGYEIVCDSIKTIKYEFDYNDICVKYFEQNYGYNGLECIGAITDMNGSIADETYLENIEPSIDTMLANVSLFRPQIKINPNQISLDELKSIDLFINTTFMNQCEYYILGYDNVSYTSQEIQNINSYQELKY